MNTPFEGVAYFPLTFSDNSFAFSDVDGDDDTDVLIIGLTNSSERIAKLYTNDGLGNFTEVMGTPFVGVSEGAVFFSDIDGDNDNDVFIIGEKYNSNFDLVKGKGRCKYFSAFLGSACVRYLFC